MKKFMLLVAPVMILLLLTTLTHAQAPVLKWDEFYPPDYEANDFQSEVILEDPYGGIVIVGNRRFESQTNPHHEVLVMRVNKDGYCFWYNSFGGEKVDYVKNDQGEVSDTIITPWDQEAKDMVMTPEGNYLITGYRDTTSNSAASPPGLLLLEISPHGEVLTDSLYYNGNLDHVMGYSIRPANGGGYIIAGSIMEGGKGSDKMMMVSLEKDDRGIYQNTGNQLIQKNEIGTSGYAKWVRAFGEGYLLAGSCINANTKFDLFLEYAGKDRYTVWTKFFGTANVDQFSDAVIYGENIFLMGYAKVPVSGSSFEYDQIYVVKTDFQGDTVWTRTYGGPAKHYGVGIVATGDGNLLIAGTAYDINMHTYMLLLKVDASTGELLWMQPYGSFYNAGVSDIALTADFSYLLSARASYTAMQDPRIYVMRLQNSATTANLAVAREGLNLDIVTGTPTKNVIEITGEKIALYGICVKIDSLVHPSVGDLEITLEHENTVVTLVDRPFHSGKNFIHTALIDAAEVAVESGYAPYTGWFRPEEALAPFMFHAPTGEWTLSVTDHGAGGLKSTTGVLEGWSLNLLVDAGSGTEVLPKEAFVNFGLEQVRPNPVGLEAVVSFRIPEPGFVNLAVYNQLGQRVGYLANEHLPEGLHERMWHPGPLAPGTYFFHLESGGMISVRKAVLAR